MPRVFQPMTTLKIGIHLRYARSVEAGSGKMSGGRRSYHSWGGHRPARCARRASAVPQRVFREPAAEDTYGRVPRIPCRDRIVGRVPIATAPAPAIFSFFKTISNTSGAGLDSSASSEDVVASTNFVMPAMSRYLSNSSLFADKAAVIRSPLSRCEHTSSTGTKVRSVSRRQSSVTSTPPDAKTPYPKVRRHESFRTGFEYRRPHTAHKRINRNYLVLLVERSKSSEIKRR